MGRFVTDLPRFQRAVALDSFVSGRGNGAIELQNNTLLGGRMTRFFAASVISLSLAVAPAVAQNAPNITAAEVARVTKSTQATGENDSWVLATMMAIVAFTALTSGSGNSVVVSDARLKRDITLVGQAANGLPLYTYRYVGQSGVYQGVMAQDVLEHSPNAIVPLPFGFLGVDYGMLGLELTRIH